MNELLHALTLSRLPGIGVMTALQLYRHYGSAQEVYACRGELKGRAATAFARWEKTRARAEAELEFCERQGISALPLQAADYPQRLRDCPDAPLVLFRRGNANLNNIHTLAIVGTRRITEYGKSFCQEFITDIARIIPDCLIVSGLAYGVDIHAHRACLKNSLPTVGVLAHGLDQIYPSSHRATAEEMLKHGALVTEYMSQTFPDKGNFVQRNRIIAGMADATLVVESADKGGALITARLADEYHREVFALPGRISDPYSRGCNALIRDNRARLLTSAADLAETLRWATASKTATPVQRELFPELTPEEETLCRLLGQAESVGINRLVIESNLPFQQVSSLLFELELKGVVKPLVGGQYRLLR